MRFQPKYSESQKKAVTWAIVDKDLSAPATVRAAAAGKLSDEDGKPLPPCKINLATARGWARDERNRRLAKGKGELTKVARPVAMRALVNRTLDLLDGELRVLERQQPGMPNRTTSRIKVAKEIAAAASAVLELERKLTDPVVEPSKGKDDKDLPSDEADALAREARKRAKRPTEQPRPQPTTEESDHASELGLRVAAETSEGRIGGVPNSATESESQASPSLVSPPSVHGWASGVSNSAGEDALID